MEEMAAMKKTGIIYDEKKTNVKEDRTARPDKGEKFSYDEAFQDSLKYFKGDELAARVWVNKYALKDSYGNLYESNPDMMHKRIASEISRIEKKYENPM